MQQCTPVTVHLYLLDALPNSKIELRFIHCLSLAHRTVCHHLERRCCCQLEKKLNLLFFFRQLVSRDHL